MGDENTIKHLGSKRLPGCKRTWCVCIFTMFWNKRNHASLCSRTQTLTGFPCRIFTLSDISKACACEVESQQTMTVTGMCGFISTNGEFSRVWFNLNKRWAPTPHANSFVHTHTHRSRGGGYKWSSLTNSLMTRWSMSGVSLISWLFNERVG